jgi:glycosyltransferase involved in cell wall biosynthesis
MGLGMRVGLMAESSSSNGFAGLLRIVAGNLRRLRFCQKIDFVLAIGEGGPLWFRRLGFPDDRIFEFAYFPAAPTRDEQAVKSIAHSTGARFIYVGQLVRRKRVDLLLKAIGKMSGQWSLRIIGSGPEECSLTALTHRLGIAERVTFCGAMRNPATIVALNGADVLVLPSRFDGYGAVVNEALLRGVPVICSNQCGARQLVRMHPDLGVVFGSEGDFHEALQRYIKLGRTFNPINGDPVIGCRSTLPLPWPAPGR